MEPVLRDAGEQLCCICLEEPVLDVHKGFVVRSSVNQHLLGNFHGCLSCASQMRKQPNAYSHTHLKTCLTCAKKIMQHQAQERPWLHPFLLLWHCPICRRNTLINHNLLTPNDQRVTRLGLWRFALFEHAYKGAIVHRDQGLYNALWDISWPQYSPWGEKFIDVVMAWENELM